MRIMHRRSFQLAAILLLHGLIFLPFIRTAAAEGDRPFANPGNWGGTGLMEIPTARVLDDGELRLGFSHAYPYNWYGLAMGIFPGLEASGRVTELRNVEGEFFDNRKDRSLDFKYQLLEESRGLPAVAIGVMDFFGTRFYPAEYVALNRQFFPLDMTLGFGHNRLKGPVEIPLLESVGLFGGLELALHEKLHLIAEYNPIEYEKDRAPVRGAVREGASFPVNVGVRIMPVPGIDLGLSFQRGDTLGIMLHLNAILGKPILPHRPDPPALVPVDRRPLEERDLHQAVHAIHQAIQQAGFSEVSVTLEEESLTAEFANGKYLSDQKASGRVLRLLLFHAPPEMKRLSAVVKRRNMPLLKVSVKPEHFEKYVFGEIPDDVFEKLVVVETAGEEGEKKEIMAGTPSETRPVFTLGVKPELETYLLDRSDYVQLRTGIKPYVIANLWEGSLLHARYDVPFYSNVESSAPTPPDAVRSDFARYMDVNYSFESLMLDQVFRISNRTFGRLSLGYLEKMYAGVQGEVLTFLGDGKWAVGVESDFGIKREPNSQFGLLDQNAHTLLGNLYYTLESLNMTFNLKLGRFLYGDYGALLDVSREYDTGVILGAWYSLTDSSELSGFNKDYNSTGIYLSLPMRMFLNRDSPGRYNYAMSPWTRDVGATLTKWQPLYWGVGGVTPDNFKGELEQMKD